MPQAPLGSAVPGLRTSTRFVALAIALVFAVLAAQPAGAQTPEPDSPRPTRSPLAEDRPVLGILGFTAPDDGGVTVARVLPDSGAEEAGLEPGDLIVEVDGNRVATMEDLTAAIQRFEVGEGVTIGYLREGERSTTEVELGSNQPEQRSPFGMIPDPNFGDEFPNRPDMPRMPGSTSAPDYRPVIILFGLLITGALVALAVILARKNRPAGDAAVETAGYVPAAGAGGSNPQEVLRLRYARGEVTREEFMTMSADLNGDAKTPPGESPTQES